MLDNKDKRWNFYSGSDQGYWKAGEFIRIDRLLAAIYVDVSIFVGEYVTCVHVAIIFLLGGGGYITPPHPLRVYNYSLSN